MHTEIIQGKWNTGIDFHDCRFDGIQALRGLAAVFVVLDHIRFLNCGAFGVDIFFCISGFMIMFSTHKDTGHFLGKRLIRILPLYYLMTVGTFLLLLLFPSMFQQTKANPVLLIKSLLFIPFDIGGGILQPLMRIGWTINCEMFFYLLFLISFRISHKYRGLICSGFLGLFVVLDNVLPHGFAPLTFYGNPVMLEFVLGILSYYLAKKLYCLLQKQIAPGRAKKNLSVTGGVFLLLGLMLFAALIITKPHVNILGFGRFFLWGLPALFIVLCFFAAGLLLPFPRWSVGLGNISFSLYLIHYYPVIFLDRMVFDFSKASPFSILGAALALILSLAASYICWLLIEKRLTEYLRRLLK